MPELVLQARNLKAYYITEAFGVRRTVRAVEDISLAVRPGEIYGIAGESGCGKSTLLKVLLGAFEPPLTVVGGSVHYTFDGDNIDALSIDEADLLALRWAKISYVPQGSMHVLNPVRRIGATFYDFISSHRPMSKRASAGMVRDYLAHFDLSPTVVNAFPHQLSGGMRQRVTIALATILSPRLVFADEPTTALDVVVQRSVMQQLKRIRNEGGSTLVLVTHDMGVQANLADRIAILYAGRLVEEGDTRTIFKDPKHPYTRHLIASLPTLDERHARESIQGRPPALDNPPSGCSFHPRCPYAMDLCKHTIPPMVTLEKGHRAACHLITDETDNAAAA